MCKYVCLLQSFKYFNIKHKTKTLVLFIAKVKHTGKIITLIFISKIMSQTQIAYVIYTSIEQGALPQTEKPRGLLVVFY